MPRSVRAAAIAVIAAALALPCASQAAFPGENGRIAFTRVASNGQTDLYSAEPNGLAEIRITEDGQSDNAAFSPDGTRLAYSTGDDIVIGDPYGDDVPTLVLSTGQYVDEIDWSPDGTRLVTALSNCAEFDCETDIYVLGVDGSGLTPLTGTIFSEHGPSWSADGSRIAFDATVAGETDVYTIRPDGTDRANLTDDVAAPAQEPDWSPDGSRIAYAGGPFNVMNVDGSGKSQISGAGLQPAWSPDGTQFARAAGRDPDWQVRPPDPVPPADGVEFPRPKGATPLYVPLVNMYRRCATGNSWHGPPLAHRSCSPPQRLSGLTVGTPDSANGLPAEAAGMVRFATVRGNPSTPADEADVRIHVEQTDVRYNNASKGYPDYPGELLLTVDLRLSDTFNSGAEGSGTVVDFPLRVVVPCAATPEPIGGRCALDTTIDAVTPGLTHERRRTLWQLGQVVLYAEGADGNPTTLDDNEPFVTQGVFVP